MNPLLTQETINGVGILLHCTAGIIVSGTLVVGWLAPYLGRKYMGHYLTQREEVLVLNEYACYQGKVLADLLYREVETPPNAGSSIKRLNSEHTNKEYLYTVVLNSILDEVDGVLIINNSKRSYKGKSSKRPACKQTLNRKINSSKINAWEGVLIS